MVATIAQASATGGQGGSSNLQMFKAHHPPTFRREEDPMVADHCSAKSERLWKL